MTMLDEGHRYVQYMMAKVLLMKVKDLNLMITVEHYTMQFLIQMKKVKILVLIYQRMKINKFSMGGLVTKFLRRGGVNPKSEEYCSKIANSNFFTLRINQRPTQPKSVVVLER